MVLKWISKRIGNMFPKSRAESARGIGALLEEQVRLENLAAWFSEKKHSVLKGLHDELRGILSEVDDLITALKKDVSALSTARLQNEKIPMREYQIMLGNRNAYIIRIRRLSEKLRTPQSVDHDSAKQFAENSIKDIAETVSALEKPYHVLQFFYANEAQKILSEIKKTESLCEEIIQMIDSNEKLSAVKRIDESIPLAVKEIELKKNFLDELKENERRINELEVLRSETEQSIKQLEENKEYDELAKIKEEMNAADSRLVEAREKIYDAFYLVNKPLRKFKQGNEHEQIIDKYLGNPLNGLEHDSSLKIIDVLAKLRLSIINSSFEIKDRMKPKVLEAIDSINKEALTNIFSIYRKALGDLETLHKKYDVHPARMEHTRLKCRLGNVAEETRIINLRMVQITEKLNSLKIEKRISELEEQLESATGIHVRVMAA